MVTVGIYTIHGCYGNLEEGLLCVPFGVFFLTSPPKRLHLLSTKIDTKNDGLENVSPDSNMAILSSC